MLAQLALKIISRNKIVLKLKYNSCQSEKNIYCSFSITNIFYIVE